MPIIRLSLLCVLMAFLQVAVTSQPAPSQADWVNALRRGGYVIVFRHGATTDQTNTNSMSRRTSPRSGNSLSRGARRQNRSESRCTS